MTRFDSLLEAVSDALVGIHQGATEEAILSASIDGIVTSWNPATERMYGYSGAELVGKSGWPLIPRDRIDEAEAILELVKARQHVKDLQTTRVRRTAQCSRCR